MHADDAREIDRMAKARNRADNPGGCLTPFLIGLAAWVVLFAIAGRLYRGWHA